MHLVHEWNIPKSSFNLKKEIVDVPCVFQIWIKKDIERNTVKEKFTLEDFEFGDRLNSNIAFQRVSRNYNIA